MDGSDDDETDDDDEPEEEDDRPIDFTTTTTSKRGEEIFERFRTAELKPPKHVIFRPMPIQFPPGGGGGVGVGGHLQQGLRRAHEDNDSGGPQSQKRRKGVQSFSIDEILSHKAASLAAKEHQENQAGGHHQAIVRPWDISSAAAAAAAAGGKGPDRSGLNSSNSSRRKSSMEDSPLDALFQMASKTFEGLKAKSGQIFGSLID